MSRSTAVVGGAYPCAQCTKAFASKQALTMHINRVHSRKILVPRQKMTREEILAKKREYNRGYRLRKGMKVRTLAQKEPKKNGAPWTPERRAKFNSTWRSKNLAKRNHKVNVKTSDVFQKEPVEDPRAYINNCPHCGYNLIPHYLAAKAAHKYA